MFDPKTWADGELITAEDLNRIEQGIAAHGTRLTAVEADIEAALTVYISEVA